MRKLFSFNMVTLDGFFEGPNQDLGWHHVDDEFNQFAVEQLSSTDAILFGRVTYQMMAGYWPTPAAIQDDPIVASQMNSYPKIVFSKTLEKAEWNNTRLVKENIGAEVSKLKQQPGKDLALFGSANLGAALMQMGLIDEFRVMVNPVVLGKGHPLFKDIGKPVALKLLKTRTFGSGNVLLYYQPLQ